VILYLVRCIEPINGPRGCGIESARDLHVPVGTRKSRADSKNIVTSLKQPIIPNPNPN
jgi:hypothetical protein